jgi:methylated-DNA-[protein]-cysteine S-methyltransferase
VVIELSERKSPVGGVNLATKDDRLVGLAFLEGWPRVERHLSRWFPDDEVHRSSGPRDVLRRLDAYLGGDLTALDGIPFQAAGTDFQRRVWSAIRDVPAGSVVTYAELARTAGGPRAVRAVGTACGANPMLLAIPCHRIVRADGDVGDYAGGPERKRWLLAHERRRSS